MADEFDPYLKWLGIRESDRPPNCYQLLGLEQFEGDSEVISNAADRQMAHVRTFQAGRHSAISQRVLNELAGARVTLLNAEKKRAYDAQLRAMAQAAQQSAANAPTATELAPELAIAPAPFDPLGTAGLAHMGLGQETISLATRPRARSKQRRPNPLRLTMLLVLAAVVLGVAIVWVVQEQRRRPPTGVVASVERTNPITEEGKVEEPIAATSSAQPRKMEGLRPDTPAGVGRRPRTPPANDQDSSPDNRVPPLQVPPAQDTGPLSPPDNAVSPPQDVPAIAPPATIERRLQLPGEDELRAAKKLVDDLFGPELKAARSPEEQARMARKLLDHANGTPDQPAARYWLYELSRRLAVEGENWTTASLAIDQASKFYQLAPLSLKTDALAEFAKSRSDTLDHGALAQAALTAIEQAIAEDDYDAAKRIAASAKKLAARSDAELIQAQVKDISESLARLDREFRGIQDAASVLTANPQDQDAATRVGTFHALIKADWETGLPLLARGSDPALAALAADDLASPNDSQQRLALADRWWDTAGKLPAGQKPQALARAGYWYTLAKSGLNSLDELKVDRRLQEIASKGARAARNAPPRRPAPAAPAKIHACCDDHFTLAINGKQVLEGGLGQLRELDCEVRPGDIITVRVSDQGGRRGFSCVLKFLETGEGFATTPGGFWQEYDPRSVNDWSNPKGMTQLRPCSAGNPGVEARTSQAAGVQVGSIWGSNATCYLTLQIPK